MNYIDILIVIVIVVAYDLFRPLVENFIEQLKHNAKGGK